MNEQTVLFDLLKEGVSPAHVVRMESKSGWTLLCGSPRYHIVRIYDSGR